jgi:hypothetical protein
LKVEAIFNQCGFMSWRLAWDSAAGHQAFLDLRTAIQQHEFRLLMLLQAEAGGLN